MGSGNPRADLESGSGGSGAAGRESAFHVGQWRVEVSRNRICDGDGQERRLEPQLASLLRYFAARPGVVVSKDELLEGVWGTRHVADSALTRAIAELRRNLGDEAHNPTYIETIPKRGYRLLAEVREASPERRPAPGRSRRVVGGVLAGALLFAGVALTDWLRSTPPHEARAASQRIAVLPLVELSAVAGQEYFADAMTDALTTVLARVPSLSVTSRRSVEQYRNSEASSLEIAEGLGVDLLLEGTIVRDSNRVRFNMQLIDARAEEHLWAGSYEREMRDVVSLQGEIVSAVTREIQGSLSPDTQRGLAGRSVDPRAHDLYLRGRHLLQSGRMRDREETRKLFEDALEIDPSYAPAWAGLAEYHAMLASYEVAPWDEAYPEAREAALKAISLDPEIAEAHAALGTVVFLYDWDWDRAERHFLRALELNPSDAGVRRQYAFFLTCQGRFDQAITHAREAVLLDPLTEDKRTGLGWILMNAGRYEESLEALQDQPAQMRRTGGNHIYLSWNHALAGRYDEAIALLEPRIDEPRGWLVRQASIGWALARGGRTAEARQVLRKMEDHVSAEGGDPYLVAIVTAGLEDLPETMKWLERSFTERSPNMIHVKIEPFFEPIRDAEPYREMVRRMKL